METVKFTVIISNLAKKNYNKQITSGLKWSVSSCFCMWGVKDPFLCHILANWRVAFGSGLFSIQGSVKTCDLEKVCGGEKPQNLLSSLVVVRSYS